MKKLILLLHFTFGVFHFTFSQTAPGIEWQRCLGGSLNDVPHQIIQTQDGGFAFTGTTLSNDSNVSSNNGISDYWVVKLDSLGNLTWQNCLGSSTYDNSNSIIETPDGSYIVCGYAGGNDSDVIGSHGSWDYWILKLSSVGILQWQKCFGGTLMEEASSIKQTSDQGYIIAGHTTSNNFDVSGNHGETDYWLVKLDSLGILQWQKCLGGSEDDRARDIQLANDGGFIITGYTRSNDLQVSGFHGTDPLNRDYWVVKTDSVGNIQWQKCLGGTYDEDALSGQQTSDGGYIIAGFSSSNDFDVTNSYGSSDYWVVKLDNVGNVQWQKSYGGTSGDAAWSIKQTFDNGYIVAGGSHSNNIDVSGNHGNGDYWIIRIDSIGNILWQKCLGGSDTEFGPSASQTFDGGYIVSGLSRSQNGDVTFNHGSSDAWIVKLYPDTPTGIANIQTSTNNIQLYPNPTKDEITINGYTLQNNQPAQLKIYDVMGKEVLGQSITNLKSHIINLNSITSGVYYLQLNNGKQMSTARFIKM